VTPFRETVLLEMLSATSTYIGVAFMAAALLIRGLYARWRSTEAVHVLEDGVHQLRWHTRTDLHQEPWPQPLGPYPRPGAAVTVYYHARHPEHWALTAPYRHTRVLFGVGAALTGLGFLLPLLPL